MEPRVPHKKYEKMVSGVGRVRMTGAWDGTARRVEPVTPARPGAGKGKRGKRGGGGGGGGDDEKNGGGAARWADALERAERTRPRGLEGVWVCTEKLHGANLCFVVDAASGEVHFSRRGAYIDTAKEKFFGSQAVLEAGAPVARRVLEWVRERRHEVEAVRVYGELVGGVYPHAAAGAPPDGVKAVQKEVYYCPDLRFVAFDVLVETAPGQAGGGGFLDPPEFYRAAADTGLECALPVMAAGLPEVLALPLEFPTRQPAAWGLPEIHLNHAEGYVIRSAAPVPFGRPRDEECPPPRRRIFKRKSPAFVEYAAAGQGKDAAAGGVELARGYITPHRIVSAVGKMGDDAAADHAALALAVANDVLVDMTAEHGLDAAGFGRLSTNNRVHFRERLLKHCRDAVREAAHRGDVPAAREA